VTEERRLTVKEGLKKYKGLNKQERYNASRKRRDFASNVKI